MLLLSRIARMPSAAAFATFPRNFAILIAFNTVIALGIAFTHRGGLGESLVYSHCIGILAMLSIDLPRRLLWPQGGTPRAAMIALLAGGTAVGFLGGSAIAGAITGQPLGANRMMGSIAITAFAGIVASWYFHNREHLANLRLEKEAFERGAAEARLKLLQAQIEPHFLFNTLANLDSLIGKDPKRACEMLGHLNDYLRSTLDTTRTAAGTLAQEFAIARGYLEIVAIRMGPRLAFSLSLPDELKDFQVPPMILQPLVENAVKHGLEPKVEGGRIEVSVSKDQNFMEIRVKDTGLGNSSTKGTGVGLANIRERLAATYGSRARLSIEHNETKGVTATVTIPA
jgi:sensor histidine kinase YesM